MYIAVGKCALCGEILSNDGYTYATYEDAQKALWNADIRPYSETHYCDDGNIGFIELAGIFEYDNLYKEKENDKMEFTVKINAPELVEAINNLASAMRGNAAPAPAAVPAPAPTPIIQPPQAAVPIAQPAPVAQPQIQQPAPAPAAVPTAAPAYTLEQLAKATTALVDAGKRDAVVSLLSSFGIQMLTQLPQEHYGAYAAKLREQGVQI